MSWNGIRSGWRRLCAVVVLLGLLPGSGQAAEPVFRAGAATSNITPHLGGKIIGGWLSPESTHVHDELHARCLVLDDGERKVAFVLVDSVGVVRPVFDAARARIAAETDLPGANVLMAATHTHSAVSARGENRFDYREDLDEYQQFLATRIVDGVKRALYNLEPARIGWGSASEPKQVFNRRWFMKEGFDLTNPFGDRDQVRMNPPRRSKFLDRPAGPIDPEISFLAVESAGGRPMALLANYSLHYVGGVPRGHLSGDYFAVFADRMQELLGADRQDPPFVGIMSNGTSGDINNIDFAGGGKRRQPYEQMRNVAGQVAAEVYKSYLEVEFKDWVRVDARMSEVDLKVRRPTPELVRWSEEVLAANPDPDPRKADKRIIYAGRTQEMLRLPDKFATPLQVVRVGDLGVTAIPFEVFAEIGLEIKEKSPFADAFTIELANGWYGYLPTAAQHKLGGYETWLGTNLVQLDAASLIVAELMRMSEELKR